MNPKQGYRLVLPQGWRKVDKAGADALFEDPARTSTSLGVVVNPVRVKDIASFGSLEDVGQKLLEAERKKVGRWTRRRRRAAAHRQQIAPAAPSARLSGALAALEEALLLPILNLTARCLSHHPSVSQQKARAAAGGALGSGGVPSC